MAGFARVHVRAISLAVGLLIGGWAAADAQTKPHLMLGVYPGGALQASSSMQTMREIDAWIASTGQRLNLAGDFMAFDFPNPEFNVPAELNAAWNNGYIPFVNITSNRTSTDIANGAIDGQVRAYAHEIAKWTAGGQRRLFIGLLPEMNGSWVVYYGGGATAFIAAYHRMRGIFEDELAKAQSPSTSISWVFVAQGSTGPPQDQFEVWYPGDAAVDVVAFSAYNYGGCPPAAPWLRWESYEFAFKPFLDRMRAMAPGKPIFIAQMASLDRPVNGVGDKDAWLDEVYTALSAYPAVRGAIYFNFRYLNDPAFSASFPNCPDLDYRIFVPGTGRWEGFRTALRRPNNFGYYAPGSPDFYNIVFARASSIFADVPASPPLLGSDGASSAFAPWIERLYAAGITGGCSASPLLYCPNDGVTRGQMAVFLLRALRGRDYTPPAATFQRFADVPLSHPFANWIEAFAGLGVTSGCGTSPPRFCPDDVVTRDQMAVFLMKATQGSGYTPPAPIGMFGDVPTFNNIYASWIEALANSGITGGCSTSPLLYCPGSPVTRAQMAVFLVRAFNL